MFALAGYYHASALAFHGGMGLGDCKWAGVVGLCLGWLSWPAVITGTLAAFLVAALPVIVQHLLGSRSQRVMLLPMAPFMTAGAVLAVVALR